MLFLGTLSLIQCWFLPGFLILSFSKTLTIEDKLILSPLLSLIINYLVVFILLIFQQFTLINFSIILITEIGLISFFLLKNINLNIFSFKSFVKKNYFQINFRLIETVIFIFLIIFIFLALSTIGEVVHLGDPVMMWNEWSKEIYSNNIPKSGDYPLAFPILGAITYLFLGTSDIEFFSRIVGLIYPLWIFVIYFRLKKLLPNNFFQLFFTFVFTLLLVFYIFRHYALFIGYSDPLLFFITFSIGYFYFLIDKKNPTLLDIILISLVISVPAITKQTGILLTAILPLILFTFDIHKKKKINYQFYLKIIFLTFMFSATWYVYKIYGYIFEYGENSNMVSLTKQVEGNYYDKLQRGLTYTFGIFYPIVLLLLVLGLKNFYSRIIFIYLVVPYFLIWSLFFGNDNRNLAVALPIIAFVMSNGIVVLFNLITKKINLNFLQTISFISLILFSIVSVKYINEKRDRVYLENLTIKKQMIRGNNIQTNILIYEYLKTEDIKIYTDDYNFTFLPTTKLQSPINNKIILLECSNIETELINSYLLYSKKLKGLCNDLIREIIFSNKKNYQIIFENQDHIFYKFN